MGPPKDNTMKNIAQSVLCSLVCLALLGLSLAIDGCGSLEKWKATGAYLAPKIASALAEAALNATAQKLTNGDKADFMDSAAAGLRASVSSADVEAVAKIWMTPPKEKIAPELAVVAKKADTLAKETMVSNETMATAFNLAADKVRALEAH